MGPSPPASSTADEAPGISASLGPTLREWLKPQKARGCVSRKARWLEAPFISHDGDELRALWPWGQHKPFAATSSCEDSPPGACHSGTDGSWWRGLVGVQGSLPRVHTLAHSRQLQRCPGDVCFFISLSPHGDKGPAPCMRPAPGDVTWPGQGGGVPSYRDVADQLTWHGSPLPSAAVVGAGGQGASASGSASAGSPRPAFAQHPRCARLCPWPQWTSARQLQCGLLLANSNEATHRGARCEGFASESGDRS